jgi:replicative DNA helicase
MAETQRLRSEGEELPGFLDELQKEHAIKEISGWDTGFANLNRALDGILPGLYLLIGPPACGKTSFAKQLFDQVVMQNSVPGIFFSFAERKKELRIKTLARLSSVENRDIRRGSAYLLHWYGMPKRTADTAELPPSWEKIKTVAEAARRWLDLTYLIECGGETNIQRVAEQIDQVSTIKSSDRMMVVIDDSQRLESGDQSRGDRLANITEQLQSIAVNRNIPVLAVWPELMEETKSSPYTWADKTPSADVILVLEKDLGRTKKLTEPNQAVNLHIIKNRGGEKGKLAFEFVPPFSKFTEVAPASTTHV